MRSIVKNHPAEDSLVIDCSDSEIFCGLLNNSGEWISMNQSGPGALEALFPCVAAVLHKANRKPGSIRRYIYCGGPGSVLGLRLCAMAIETWCRLSPAPVQRFSYGSLQLTAALLLNDNPGLENATILSDWKKDAWHCLMIQNRAFEKLTVLPADSLQSIEGPIYHLPGRKGWQDPPDSACTLIYQPSRFNTAINSYELLQPTEAVELYQTGGNTFTKWNAQRHRAPDS